MDGHTPTPWSNSDTTGPTKGDSLLIDALPVFVEQTVIVHLRDVHIHDEDSKDL